MATKAYAQVRAVDLTIDSNQKLATMPQDFLGLSYESAQLADPAFFSASNTTLVRAFRDLSPRGVLRLGGNLSDVTLWKGSAANTIAPEEAAKVRGFYEWRLADKKAASERPATLGRDGIVALGTFVGATGGEGYYAPLTGEPNATKLRPQYSGMLLAQRFTGATFVGASLGGDARDVTAYAARIDDTLLVAAVNKSGNPVQVRLRESAARPTECWTLTAPSLDAKDGVEFAQAGPDQRLVPAYSAMLWKLSLTRARN
jgi:hypothetical protein